MKLGLMLYIYVVSQQPCLLENIELRFSPDLISISTNPWNTKVNFCASVTALNRKLEKSLSSHLKIGLTPTKF